MLAAKTGNSQIPSMSQWLNRIKIHFLPSSQASEDVGGDCLCSVQPFRDLGAPIFCCPFLYVSRSLSILLSHLQMRKEHGSHVGGFHGAGPKETRDSYSIGQNSVPWPQLAGERIKNIVQLCVWEEEENMDVGDNQCLDVWGPRFWPEKRCYFLMWIHMVDSGHPHKVVSLLSLEYWLRNTFLPSLLWSSIITVPK